MSDFEQRVISGKDISVTDYTDATVGVITALATSGKSSIQLSAVTTLAGISNGYGGKILYILNTSGLPIVIANASILASANDRILTGNGSNITIGADGAVIFKYDGTSLRWRIAGDGVQGPQGSQGVQGSAGAQGFQGFQGLQGSQGSQGFQGLQGSQGSQGFQGGNDPTAFTDVVATRLGYKQYVVGTAYNGGVTPTLTSGTGTMANTRSVLVPYEMQDGTWRLRFNYVFSVSGAVAIPAGGFTVSTSGITYKNTANYLQAVNAFTDAATNIINWSYANPNASTILLHFSTSNNINQTDYEISGDVELDSKPTWAY